MCGGQDGRGKQFLISKTLKLPIKMTQTKNNRQNKQKTKMLVEHQKGKIHERKSFKNL